MEAEENAEIGCSFGCVPPGLLWGNYVCSFKGPLLKIFRGSFLLVNSNQSFLIQRESLSVIVGVIMSRRLG